MCTLNTLKENLELFKKLNPLDSAVMITDDKGTILEFSPGKNFRVVISVNSKVPESSAVAKCLKTGKEVHMNLPSEIYGIPVRAIATPIFDNNKLIGSIATCTTLDAQETLQNVSQNIISTSEEITATSEEVASSATSLSDKILNLKDKIEDIANEIKGTDNIISFINGVSSNAKLLGLNAAIEAARAGEYGKSFSVVAKEIRKMSDDSRKSVDEIKDILNIINEKSLIMLDVINEISGIGEQQSIATKEIATAIQELTSSTMNLEEISKII